MRRFLFALPLLWLLTVSAFADGAKPRVGVFFYPEEEDDATSALSTNANRVFRFDLKKNKALAYIELNQALDSDNPPYKLAFEQAKKKYAEGVSLLKASKAEKAVPVLNESFLLYLNSFSFNQDAEEVREVCLDLAKAAFLSRKPLVSAETAFRRALLLDPSLKFSVERYENPRLEEPFNAAKLQLAAAEKGSFLVESTPSHAEIYIDGTFAGVSPVTVSDLSLGEHFVSVRKDGYERYNDLIVVNAKSTEKMVAYLNELPRLRLFEEAITASKLDVGKNELDAASPVLNFKNLYALDIMILGNIDHTEGDPTKLRVTAYVYDLRSRQRINRKEREFSTTSPSLDTDIAAFARSAFLDANKKPIRLDGTPLDEKQLLCVEEKTKNDPNCKPEKPPISSRPWFIPAVSVLAVGAVGSALFFSGVLVPEFQCNDGSCVGTGLP
jgi:hypothetical protein